MAADYSFKFGRVTISGTCLGGQEEWSTGFQIGLEGADIPALVPGVAEQVAAAWTVFFQDADHAFSNTYVTDQVKVSVINTNGKTDLDNIDYYPYPVPINGPRGGAIFPPQITLAATLTSEFQRGLASKGRMYLPGLAEAVDIGTGQLGATFRGTLADGLKLMLDTINANIAIPGSVIIASKGHKQAGLDVDGQPVYLDGRNALVTGCRVGSVYDTQRRRRNGLTESYTTRVLA